LVLATVLVIFAVTIDTSFPMPQHARQVAFATKTAETISPIGLDLDDVLSGVRLARAAKELSFQDYRLAPFAETRR
jgi:hypothetical protein